MIQTRAPLSATLATLDAIGEETRLRLCALLAEAELAVSELVQILGQSQPRVSRHLKLLLEAGLVERHREGAWAFFHLAAKGPGAALAHTVLASIDANDPRLIADRARLDEVRATRAARAEKYFATQAPVWTETRRLLAPEAEVEAAIIDAAGTGFARLLDIGCGAGRMLELLAPRAEQAVGVDLSPAMLGVARAQIEQAGLRNVQLRQGDIYALPVEGGVFDLAVVHQVLHYLDTPARALREAARALAPGGRLIVVDFAPHQCELLRERHEHRRLGFSRAEVEDYLAGAGLTALAHRDLAPAGAAGDEKLTVSLWLAKKN
ncbi:demethylmenaquinone methyltransferase/2-methoxy-6-polyprenyl-1,4-benzoquinol methylase/ArsR family transcriptional regulator [Rhodoblastus acidophilus]|uniref:ArsR/SmtB family transcription factor n=1 Tax=Rhodoblastus acidophilus TaxID=1074 RepID=UPI002225B104|nr:metalloregulator ArsR/SmtB family transcription factor [Rhodoblastus acidophilus]MCW2282518.1 demethylmenaquinone methyltransferase/2-methoxy-6-polyprenyl-1,4-benzoquinol methylase/ArsR family transcriptional regulator [Rhodoblastus acidophilus]MCW2331379.1 demethylmenaquinone methyltransferase/2-methoxy-6-polyprenyl-1,4-benzoquinol methylase/ArsR family transcriptional regulator [Rhodoblastus acidophilus]